MDSPTGIIPEDLMYPAMRKQAVEFIKSTAYPGHMKRELLFAWARTVVVRLSEKEVIEVMSSGPQPETRT